MTLITAAEQNRSLALPETSRPVLLNGWVSDEPVAIWESGGQVCISGAVKFGPTGTAVFELGESQRPAEDVASEGVTVSTGGEVVVHGGETQVIDAAFTASREPDDRAPSPTL